MSGDGESVGVTRDVSRSSDTDASRGAGSDRGSGGVSDSPGGTGEGGGGLRRVAGRVPANQLVSGEVRESFVAACEVIHMVKTDRGLVYMVSFDGSDRLFPVVSDGVFSDAEGVDEMVCGDVTAYPADAERLIDVVDRDMLASAIRSATGCNDVSAYFSPDGASDGDGVSDGEGVVFPEQCAAVHVVECGSDEYCVVEGLYGSVREARGGLDESGFTVGESVPVSVSPRSLVDGDVDSDAFFYDPRADELAAFADGVAGHALLLHHSNVGGVSRVERFLSSVTSRGVVNPGAVDVVSAMMLACFALSLFAVFSFDAGSVVRRVAMGVMGVSGVLVVVGIVLMRRLYAVQDADAYSVVDPCVVRGNAVSAGLESRSGGVSGGGSVRRVESVELRVSESVDGVVASGVVGGCEETWVWRRDSRGVLPGAVRDVFGDVSSLRGDVVPVTVREAGVGDESVLVCESGEWVVTGS